MRTQFRSGLIALLILVVGGFARAADDLNADVFLREESSVSAPAGASSGWLPRLEFKGNETFTPQQIRDGLERNYDLTLAARTATPDDDLAPLIVNAVKNGYLRAGFPNVEVEAAAAEAAGGIRLRIAEGRRYTKGKVKVVGARQVSAEALIRWMTEEWYPLNAVQVSFADQAGKERSVWVENEKFERKPATPKWVPGKPASFDDLAFEELREQLEWAFQVQGFFSPRFEIEIELAEDQATGILVVSIESEGEPATVEEVVVSGAEKFSRESLLGYLAVKPGMGYTGRTDAELERRLWESGRYLRHEVSATFVSPRSAEPEVEIPDLPGDEDSAEAEAEVLPQNRVRLSILVTENPSAPEFSAKLTDVQLALLNVARWMEQWSIAATNDELELEIVIDPSKAHPPHADATDYELRFRVAGGVDRAAVLDLSIGHRGAPPAFQQTCAFTPQETVLLSSRGARRYESRSPVTRQLVLDVFETLGHQGDEDQRNSRRMEFGLRPLKENELNPFRLRLLIPPAEALRLGALDETQSEIKDGQLLIKSDSLHVDFDASTGKLQRLQIQSAELGGTITAQFKPGTVARAVDHFVRLRKELPGAGADAPRSDSIVRHLAIALGELIASESSDRARPVAASLIRLIERWQPPSLHGRVMRLLDSTDSEEGDFVVPAPPIDIHTAGAAVVWNAPMSGRLLPIVRAALPRQGRFQELGRDLLLAFPDASQAPLLLQTIYMPARRDECGPLSTLVQMALTYCHPSAIYGLARHGYLRMTPTLFEKDFQLLLSGDGWLSECLISLLTAARDLPPDEIRTLTQLCPDAHCQEALAKAFADWKRKPETPALEALNPCIPHLWEFCARSGLAEYFLTIAHSEPQPPKAEADPPKPKSDSPTGAKYFGLER